MISKLISLVGAISALAISNAVDTTSDKELQELLKNGIHMQVGDMYLISFSGDTLAQVSRPTEKDNFEIVSTVTGQQQVQINGKGQSQMALTLTLQGTSADASMQPSYLLVSDPEAVKIPIFVSAQTTEDTQDPLPTKKDEKNEKKADKK